MNLAAAEVVIDSSAASCCGTPSAATPGSAFSGASISTRRSSCDVLPHEFLKTPLDYLRAGGFDVRRREEILMAWREKWARDQEQRKNRIAQGVITSSIGSFAAAQRLG